ncbi:hypothetical protein [Chryseolinea lacunae]|uniref:Outer membrane protein beta-barrel domain-containing protein n=1 Tax=Chryseolinea lacunae TaxID=2801331 RepID=A0ABS1KKC4_9BACT|nr:hypothetical protein [Chryseolinea lacunae]MBL0739692.1 hypothetical protein [Chryseolinea lacunae]
MKKHFLVLVACSIVITTLAQTDTNKETTPKRRPYVSSGGEAIFSLANLSIAGAERGTVLRFSPFFNVQTWVHMDRNEHFGWFSGLTLRNVGLIYDVPGTGIRKKARTYNVGIPLAFKVGDMDGKFVYAGYEIELAFNYKEKTFENEKKTDKFNVWFSDRVNLFQHGFFVGAQLPHGANIKFKYYLSRFYNNNYSERDANGVVTQPYAPIDANVFYFALSFMLRREEMEKFKKPITYSTRR